MIGDNPRRPLIRRKSTFKDVTDAYFNDPNSTGIKITIRASFSYNYLPSNTATISGNRQFIVFIQNTIEFLHILRLL